MMNIFPIVNSVKCTKGLEGCNRKQPGTNQQTWQTGKPTTKIIPSIVLYYQ